MTNPVLNPTFATPVAVIPTLPTLQLTEDEQRICNWLSMRIFDQKEILRVSGLYYDGEQRIQDLGISVPPSLKGLRTIAGWPQVGIDALDERLDVEGFRFPGATDVDEDLWDIWTANDLEEESTLAHLDSMIYGREYVIVGPGDGDQPLITCESPLNMTAIWDARMRKVTASLQMYLDADFSSDTYGQEIAALYLPGRSIYMARPNSGQWEITNKDTHNLIDQAGDPLVPVLRMANQQRTSNREGRSEITPAWRSITDAACRTLLGAEISREFFAAPRRWAMGVAEENFVAPDGTPKEGWQTYMGKVWAIDRDENGDLPQVGQFAPQDPTAYTKLLDMYAMQFASIAKLPPHYLGLISDGNPASADAIRANEIRLVKRAERKQKAFGGVWEQALRMALIIRDGSAPDQAHQIETSWADAATPTVAATTDALSKQVQAGMVPATSDVVLKRAGYSGVERSRLEADRKLDEGAQILAELSQSLQAKETRVISSVDGAINPAVAHAVLPPVKPTTPINDPATAGS